MQNNLSSNDWSKLEYLRQCYEAGQITGDELSDILEQSIDAELSKECSNIDNDWLDACATLMVDADKEKLSLLPNHTKENLQSIKKRLKHSSLHCHIHPANSIPRLCFAASIVLLLFGVTITWSSIQAHQSVDEQVYMLTGKQIHLGSDISANADTPSEYQQFETSEYQTLCSHLGYAPIIPRWLPEGWNLVSYYVSHDGSTLSLDVAYEKEGEPYILGYTYVYVTDVSDISVDFYQDMTGNYEQLSNGCKVYFTTNMDHVLAVWSTDKTYSCISGPISNEEVIQMILSVK